MTLSEIAKYRLANQQLGKTNLKTPKDVTEWMGAIQAQDFEMSKWAAGIRLKDSKESQIQAAYDKGEIIRTHLLRPTWHLASADDVYWMIDLSAGKIISSLKSRWKQLELTEDIFKKCRKNIEKSLAGGKHLERNKIKEVLTRIKISTEENRLSHILLRAELDKIICSGKSKGKNQTYAHFDERIKKKEKFNREEAAARLAEKYFYSRGRQL